MLIEQTIRWATSAKDKERLESLIDRAMKARIITLKDANILHALRKYRNGYMHSDFHGYAFPIDGLLYPVNEEETAEILFSKFSNHCFKIVEKVLTN